MPDIDALNVLDAHVTINHADRPTTPTHIYLFQLWILKCLRQLLVSDGRCIEVRGHGSHSYSEKKNNIWENCKLDVFLDALDTWNHEANSQLQVQLLTRIGQSMGSPGSEATSFWDGGKMKLGTWINSHRIGISHLRECEFFRAAGMVLLYLSTRAPSVSGETKVLGPNLSKIVESLGCGIFSFTVLSTWSYISFREEIIKKPETQLKNCLDHRM